ncbi:hypothetical protein [Micromonospora sp. NPDC048947]|uniref:hypothetical protein n=1 Tax=Micromonospora sp. NPDC048947 TaxID=3154826 RepID=UPI00340562D5
MTYRFLSTLSTDVHEHLEETVVEMVHLFGISEAEAVARINAAWSGSDFLESSKLVLHEDPHYWAIFLYYGGNVPDWSDTADRSSWKPVDPPVDARFWTDLS